MLYQDLYQSLIKKLSPQQNKFSLLYLLENFVLDGTKLPHQHKHKGTLNQFILMLPNTQMQSHACQAQTYDYNVLTRKLLCQVTAPCCHNIYRKLPLENCLDVLQPLLYCLPITCLWQPMHTIQHIQPSLICPFTNMLRAWPVLMPASSLGSIVHIVHTTQ